MVREARVEPLPEVAALVLLDQLLQRIVGLREGARRHEPPPAARPASTRRRVTPRFCRAILSFLTSLANSFQLARACPRLQRSSGTPAKTEPGRQNSYTTQPGRGFRELSQRMNIAHDFRSDIEAVSAIEAVPTILNVICRVTGMGFAAVARVTEERWICCAVNDEIQFGLQPGGELKVETTICNEIRQSREAGRHRPCGRGRALLPAITRRRCTASRATSRCRSSSRTAASSARCARSIRGRTA